MSARSWLLALYVWASACGGRTSTRDGSTGSTPEFVPSGSGGVAMDVPPEEAGESSGSGAPGCDGPGARFATSVVDYAFGGGQSFNQDVFPEPILGPPEANQPRSVVSLGNGGFVTVAFVGNAVVDGPGVDFTVFENPLPAFRELATVSVSDDGVTWFDFPCTADTDDSESSRCAGVQPVNSSSRNGVDPLDPTVSGGDLFDLAELGVSRAVYVRVTDRPDRVGDSADVFDLDAIAIVNAECP